MRGTLEYDGTRNPPETRVFHTGGQYNPAPTQMPPENALIPPLTNYTLGGLEPFTIYEFQVFVKLNFGFYLSYDSKITVKPVLSGHSKRRPKLFFKTDYSLM